MMFRFRSCFILIVKELAQAVIAGADASIHRASPSFASFSFLNHSTTARAGQRQISLKAKCSAHEKTLTLSLRCNG